MPGHKHFRGATLGATPTGKFSRLVRYVQTSSLAACVLRYRSTRPLQVPLHAVHDPRARRYALQHAALLEVRQTIPTDAGGAVRQNTYSTTTRLGLNWTNKTQIYGACD